MQRDKYELPFTYDASTMVASARQVNFWAKQGAIEAVLARELPKEELADMTDELAVPGEILVYGATVIHHSKRPLVQNYYNFIKTEEKAKTEKEIFLSLNLRKLIHIIQSLKIITGRIFLLMMI